MYECKNVKMGSVGEFESVWRSIEYGSEEKNSYLSKPEVLNSLVDGLKSYRPPGGSPEADKIKNNKDLSTVEKSAALRFSALSGLSEEQSMKLYQSNQENINEKLKQQFLGKLKHNLEKVTKMSTYWLETFTPYVID